MNRSDGSTNLDVLLLHGAWCGPWVWDEVRTALTESGLRVVAAQLPREQATAGISRHVAAVLDQIGTQSVELAVGHSLAGILLEPLAAQRPVRSLMYLTAFVPHSGVTLRGQWKTNPGLIRPEWAPAVSSDSAGTTRWTQIDAAVEYMLNVCPPDTARAAAARLGPQAWTLAQDVPEAPLITPSAVVTAAHDRLLDSGQLRRSAERIPNAAFAQIESDHMPMISRPLELTELIRRSLPPAL